MTFLLFPFHMFSCISYASSTGSCSSNSSSSSSSSSRSSSSSSSRSEVGNLEEECGLVPVFLHKLCTTKVRDSTAPATVVGDSTAPSIVVEGCEYLQQLLSSVPDKNHRAVGDVPKHRFTKLTANVQLANKEN